MEIRLLMTIISVIVCYNIADDKGYKKGQAVLCGLFFSAFAMAYYITAKKKGPKDNVFVTPPKE